MSVERRELDDTERSALDSVKYLPEMVEMD